MRSAPPLALLLAFALASNAAEDAGPTRLADRCSPGTQIDMHECIARAVAVAEARMNDRYGLLIRSLSDPRLLKQSQTHWLSYRTATCSYVASGYDSPGGMHSVSVGICRAELAERRAKELEEFSSWSCNGCPPRKQ